MVFLPRKYIVIFFLIVVVVSEMTRDVGCEELVQRAYLIVPAFDANLQCPKEV